MKKVYWRPRAVSRPALVLIAVVSVLGLLVVEFQQHERQRPYFAEKLEAARAAKRAFDVVKEARVRMGPPIDPTVDPYETGIIGLIQSPVTSVAGVLPAKQTAANPNFAAVLVEMLKEAGVREGDVVALGCSGSFPSLNICAYAACETLKTEPIAISSGAASQWGGNVPDLLWIDMERILAEQGALKTRSLAASIGGFEDQGLGLTDEGRELVKEAIERNGLKLIEEADFDKNVEDRLKMYRDAAQGKPIKCYINVGGGAVSVGRATGKKLFHPGLNFRPPVSAGQVNGVMPRLSLEGIPCIHLIQVVQIAERYGLIEPVEEPTPTGDAFVQMREVGQADIFSGIDYNRTLTALVLATILASLWGFIRTDIGFRLLRGGARRKSSGPPEPMV